MATLRYLCPYECTFHSVDVGSGKPITNIFYYKNNTATGAPPAYGASLPGSDNALMTAGISTRFNTDILPLLNANFSRQDLTTRAIIGKQYKTPFEPILVLTPGAPINITTTLPHGLTTGDQVFLQGVTSPPTSNGTWTITVGSATDFTLNGSNSALLWSGDGAWQVASGALQYTYADKFVQVSAAFGGVVGDALPLFATGSVRRLNSGVGRSFRSRVSFSPLSEADSLDGGLLPGVRAAWNAALATFTNTSVANGATDAGAAQTYNWSVSKKLASMQPPIFTQSDTWAKIVGSMIIQRNTGSLTRRKPRLTAVIT